MATLTNSYTCSTSGITFKGRVDGLQYSGTNSMYQYSWSLYRTYTTDGGATWSSFDLFDTYSGYTSAGGGSNTGYAEATFSGLRPSSYDTSNNYTYFIYEIILEVNYDNNGWNAIYPADSTVVYITDSTYNTSSSQKTTVSFNYINPDANVSLYMGDNAISSIGMDYTTTSITGGFSIVIRKLIPDYTYNFYTRNYVMSNSYFDINFSSQSITTTAWPTMANTAPTLNHRNSGGVNLSWADHGYEGSGFAYYVVIDDIYALECPYHTNQDVNFGDFSISHSYKVCPSIYGFSQDGLYDIRINGVYTNSSSFYNAPAAVGGITVGTKTTTSIQVTATGLPSLYSAVEWRWRIYGSSDAFSSYANYGGSLTYTITGLTAGTTYEIQCWTYYATTGLISIDNFWVMPSTTSLPTLAQPSFTTSGVTVNSITYTLASVANATWYNMDLYKNGVLQTNNATSVANSGSFTGLVSNTAYSIIITVTASGYNSNTRTYNFTTSTLTVGIPTNVTVSQPLSSLSVDLYYSWGTSATTMDFRWGTDGTNWNTYSSQSLNLYPAVNYNIGVATIGNKYFQVRSVNSDGTNTVYSTWVNASPYPVNVVAVNTRPSNFAWTTTISQGGNIYSTDFVNKTLYILTSVEWNAFITKINAFRVYKGLGNYSFTAVSSGTLITKEIINQTITAINDIPSKTINPPATLVTGDIINKASLYTGLRDALNSVT